MWLLLIAVPLLPLLAAAMIVLLRMQPQPAARLAVASSALVLVAACVTLIVAATSGRLDLLLTGDTGRAIIGITADRVGAVLIVLGAFVGTIVHSFASRSLLGDPRARRFHLGALVLMSATSLVALSATASGVAAAWVATSITLVVLLGHKAPWRPAVAAQRRTARSLAIGDLALVAAALITIVTVGDIDMRDVERAATGLDAERFMSLNALTIVAVLLVVAGVARSALVPLHRWLPSTLAAPTPVSALLHAGVVNGAGVLLIRFASIYGSSTLAMTLALILGLATACYATAVMLVRTDVKGALVWSTSGQMGFMVLQLAVGAFAAALFHIVGHAMYKAALFLGAGGAITSHHRQTLREHPGRAGSSALAGVTMGVFAPLAAFVVAVQLINPDLSDAALLLVVVFGALSAGRAATGWMRAAPFRTAITVALSLGGVVAMAFSYVGGLALFKGFVGGAMPDVVPGAIGPIALVTVLSAIAAAALFVVGLGGVRGDALRGAIFARLVSTGATQLSRTTAREEATVAGLPGALFDAGDNHPPPALVHSSELVSMGDPK